MKLSYAAWFGYLKKISLLHSLIKPEPGCFGNGLFEFSKVWLVLNPALCHFLSLWWLWIGGEKPHHSVWLSQWHRNLWKWGMHTGQGEDLIQLWATSPDEVCLQVPLWAVPQGDPQVGSCRNWEISPIAFRPITRSSFGHPHHPLCGLRGAIYGCEGIGSFRFLN